MNGVKKSAGSRFWLFIHRMFSGLQRNLLAVALLSGTTFAARGQDTASWKGIMEMVTLSGHYKNVQNLSFAVDIRYTDSVNTATAVEQMQARYKLHKGSFYSLIDSTEFIQGSRYQLKINHYDSVISVYNRRETADLFNIPVKDSLFWSLTQSVHAGDVNDSVRLIRIVFRPGARFTSYELTYIKGSYRIRQVKCYFSAHQPGVDPGLFPSGKALISFSYRDYSTEPVGGAWFNEDKFVTLREGRFVPQPAYAGYYIETNISQ